jgi:hypothetical protein
MGGSDRALMLGCQRSRVLAAFALPTCSEAPQQPSTGSRCSSFSIAALTIWVIYVSMQTGIPAKPAANIARLAPGYAPSFSLIALVLAIAGSAAWIWLVHWRTRRSRHPLWKSMVLPASGVSLCWLLVMTLLLPPLDHARSYRSLVTASRTGTARRLHRCTRHVARAGGSPRVPRRLPRRCEDARDPHELSISAVDGNRQAPAPAVPGWQFVARERRNTNDEEVTAVYRRTEAPG